MGNPLFAKKPLDTLLKEAGEAGEHTLKRTLGPVNLIMLGIGAIIGAGLFVRTAAAIADRAGPSVVLAFIVAGVGCAFAGLCYAEFASMIPVAGSAYTYSYATMGELVAWIIGWDLVLEYAVGAATVAIASAVRTKRPAPMIAPIPSATSDQGPSVRLRGVSALCARRRSIDFVRNNVLATICSPFVIDFSIPWPVMQ